MLHETHSLTLRHSHTCNARDASLLLTQSLTRYPRRLLLALCTDLRRILQERDVQLATERQMREEAEARAAAAEALLKRAESAPTQSPTPQLADDGPTQIMECVVPPPSVCVYALCLC